MSGPKVIRIVTREELVAICERHMARLERALERWERRLSRVNLIGQSEIAEMRARRDAIAALVDADRFDDLQSASGREIAFLEADAEARIECESKRRSQIKNASERIVVTATALIGSIDESSVTVPAELMDRARTIAAGQAGDLAGANAVLNELLGLIASDEESRTNSLTQAQQALAAALGEQASTQSFEDWLDGTPHRKPTLRERINSHIARLESEYGETAARPYIERLVAIAAATDPNRQRMQADTLVLDLAREAQQRKQFGLLEAELEMLDGELATLIGEAGQQARQLVAAAIRSGDARQAEHALEQGRALVEREQEALAAATRREVLLTQLSRLGYEVREGMDTALVDGNQVVLRKAADTGYGVEVMSPPGGKLQVRVVAFGDAGASRDAIKDRDMETIWCSELGEISRSFGDGGGALAIERAVDAGALPLKIVPRTSIDTSRPRVSTTAPKTMRQPAKR